jgi:hypothetical protein
MVFLGQLVVCKEAVPSCKEDILHPRQVRQRAKHNHIICSYQRRVLAGMQTGPWLCEEGLLRGGGLVWISRSAVW